MDIRQTVYITNNGDSAINGWTVDFDLGVGLTNFWSATDGSRRGDTYTFSNAAWNGNIAPGSTVTFGLQANSSADTTIENVIFNGESTGGGGAPDPDPDPEPDPIVVPTLSINDVSLNEGNSGTRNAQLQSDAFRSKPRSPSPSKRSP